MTKEDVLKKVIEVYSDIIEEATGSKADITEDSKLSREEGFDSLGIVDFFVNIEEECNINLEDAIVDIRNAENIRDLVEIVYRKVATGNM